MDKKRVYTFGNGRAEGKADMKNLLGGKKEKRTSPIGESDNNGCGCRRKSHRKSQ